jgi:hypothetical protein
MNWRGRIRKLERAVRARQGPTNRAFDHRATEAYHDACSAWQESYIRWAVHGIGAEPGPVPVHPHGPRRRSGAAARRSEMSCACTLARLRGIIGEADYLVGMDAEAREQSDQLRADFQEAAQFHGMETAGRPFAPRRGDGPPASPTGG